MCVSSVTRVRGFTWVRVARHCSITCASVVAGLPMTSPLMFLPVKSARRAFAASKESHASKFRFPSARRA
jgi:hypothetical protein